MMLVKFNKCKFMIVRLKLKNLNNKHRNKEIPFVTLTKELRKLDLNQSDKSPMNSPPML